MSRTASGTFDDLRAIHLHGSLGEKFGTLHRLAVSSPAEAVRALCILLKGFRAALETGEWHVVRGDALSLGEKELRFGLGSQSLHILPVVSGAGDTGGGLLKIVAGLALVGAAFIPGVAAIPILAQASLGIGLSLAANGVTSLISSKPAAANQRAGVEDRPSFAFSGPENVSVQGGCVPLVYGRMLVGSIVISAGLSPEQA